MTYTATVTDQAKTALPRAEGALEVSSKQTPRGSAIDRLYQKGALKAVFPRSETFTSVLVNTSGGVTGGDRFRLSASAGPGSHLTLTTQAAERAYRALPGAPGRIRNTLSAAPGARLWWLPQETIFFDGAHLERRLRCDLAPDAEFLLIEPLILGRAAMGERHVTGQISDRIEIHRSGKIAYLDAWSFAGDITAHFNRRAIGSGATAMASLVYVGPRAESLLTPVRGHLGTGGGASLRDPNVLVARILAEDGYHLRQRIVPLLDFLTEARLPTCWRL